MAHLKAGGVHLEIAEVVESNGENLQSRQHKFTAPLGAKFALSVLSIAT